MATAAFPSPQTDAGRAGLAALIAEPARAVVALDFDGTLAPVVPDPAQARIHPAARAAIARIAPHLDSVVVVTGRPAQVAADYGTLGGIAGLAVLGHYGLERLDCATGRITAPDTPPGVAAVRVALPRVLRDLDAGEAFIEDKGRSLAVHTRRAADPVGLLGRLRRPLGDLAAEHQLRVEPGRLVLELRPQGMDKGVALTGYLAERDVAAVLYAGDDLGDLPAFDAVDEGRAHGRPGLIVCSGSDEVIEVAHRADVVVDGPSGVARLLGAYATALQAGGTASSASS